MLDHFFSGMSFALTCSCRREMHLLSRYQAPSFLLENEAFNSWMQLFAQIVSIEVDAPADEDTADWPQRPVWKLKKWTCRTLQTLFQRYARHLPRTTCVHLVSWRLKILCDLPSQTPRLALSPSRILNPTFIACCPSCTRLNLVSSHRLYLVL